MVGCLSPQLWQMAETHGHTRRFRSARSPRLNRSVPVGFINFEVPRAVVRSASIRSSSNCRCHGRQFGFKEPKKVLERQRTHNSNTRLKKGCEENATTFTNTVQIAISTVFTNNEYLSYIFLGRQKRSRKLKLFGDSIKYLWDGKKILNTGKDKKKRVNQGSISQLQIRLNIAKT